jgi:hypothetical protein
MNHREAEAAVELMSETDPEEHYRVERHGAGYRVRDGRTDELLGDGEVRSFVQFLRARAEWRRNRATDSNNKTENERNLR